MPVAIIPFLYMADSLKTQTFVYVFFIYHFIIGKKVKIYLTLFVPFFKDIYIKKPFPKKEKAYTITLQVNNYFKTMELYAGRMTLPAFILTDRY